MPGVRTASGNWLQPKFSTLYRLKTPTRWTRNGCYQLVTSYTHAMLAFHWSRLTSIRCLFFMGHGLYLCNNCSPLIIAYTHVFLVSDNHFIDFISGRMYLSTTSAGFIASQGDILHKILWLAGKKERRWVDIKNKDAFLFDCLFVTFF